MYNISVPIGLHYTICADISEISQFEEEEEILFDLDSVFELIEVVEDTAKVDRWIIRLQATDRGGILADKYVADSNRQLKESSGDILFGKLLIDMGDPDKAINYFQRLLTEPSKDQQGP